MADTDDRRLYRNELYYLSYPCTYVGTWPLTILNWQFLVWMQAYSCSLKISLEQLRCAIIKWQEAPSNKCEIQIYESASRVKPILKFKHKILHVYGPSILFCHLRTSLWILLNAYWYSLIRSRLMLVFLIFEFVYNHDDGLFTALGWTRDFIRGKFMTITP